METFDYSYNADRVWTEKPSECKYIHFKCYHCGAEKWKKNINGRVSAACGCSQKSINKKRNVPFEDANASQGHRTFYFLGKEWVQFYDDCKIIKYNGERCDGKCYKFIGLLNVTPEQDAKIKQEKKDGNCLLVTGKNYNAKDLLVEIDKVNLLTRPKPKKTKKRKISATKSSRSKKKSRSTASPRNKYATTTSTVPSTPHQQHQDATDSGSESSDSSGDDTSSSWTPNPDNRPIKRQKRQNIQNTIVTEKVNKNVNRVSGPGAAVKPTSSLTRSRAAISTTTSFDDSNQSNPSDAASKPCSVDSDATEDGPHIINNNNNRRYALDNNNKNANNQISTITFAKNKESSNNAKMRTERESKKYVECIDLTTVEDELVTSNYDNTSNALVPEYNPNNAITTTSSLGPASNMFNNLNKKKRQSESCDNNNKNKESEGPFTTTSSLGGGGGDVNNLNNKKRQSISCNNNNKNKESDAAITTRSSLGGAGGASNILNNSNNKKKKSISCNNNNNTKESDRPIATTTSLGSAGAANSNINGLNNQQSQPSAGNDDAIWYTMLDEPHMDVSSIKALVDNFTPAAADTALSGAVVEFIDAFKNNHAHWLFTRQDEQFLEQKMMILLDAYTNNILFGDKAELPAAPPEVQQVYSKLLKEATAAISVVYGGLGSQQDKQLFVLKLKDTIKKHLKYKK